MSTMISKQVSDRERSSREVLAAVETYLRTSVSRLDMLLAPYAPTPPNTPAAPFTLEPLCQTLHRWLESATQTMVKADQDHHAELRDDAPTLARRDQAASDLYQLTTSVRATYTERFGSEFGAALGVKGRTPVDPQTLHQFTGNLARAVEEVAAKPAQGPRSFVTIDHGLALSTLHKLRDALGASLNEVALERREAQVSQVAKDRAIEAYDAAFRFVATFAELALNLAGETALASRVRPSRRPGITAGVADGPEPDPALPADPAPAT